MAENIKLISGQQQNFTVDQGYFYLFDYAQDNIIVKTDDGNTAFSYPLDTLIANQVRSTEFDGVYFWSLENPDTSNNIIRQWKLDNFIAKLQNTFTYNVDATHRYDSTAFSVEHYHDSFAANASASGTSIQLTTYSGSSALNFTTTSGDGLTLHLGPNTNGEEEDVTVTGTITGGVAISGALAGGLQYDYQLGDDIHFYTHLWVFNNYDGLNATGALYKFDAYTGDYMTRYGSGAYNGVGAATFFKVSSFADYGTVDALIYIKSTNMLFINTGAAGATLPYYGSMVLENIYNDESNIISVVDLAIDGDNVYRLQKREDGGSGDWPQYNYDLSSLSSFISSISLYV